MSSRRRFQPFIPAAAVVAVAVAALGAAWLAPRQSDQVADDRPALQAAPAAVVKAPPLDMLRQAVACRDCQEPAAPAGRY
jgi:hypothetical protein